MADLVSAQQALSQQVASGAITPQAAQAELRRQMLEKSKGDLSQQVQGGGINQAQADAELGRLSGMDYGALSGNYGVGPLPGGQTQSSTPIVPGANAPGLTLPNVGFNNEMPLKTGQDAINAGFNTAYQGSIAGNILSNPNQTSQFGSQNVSIGPDGQPQVTQVLSKPNQDVVSGIQFGAVKANDALGGMLGGGAFGSAYTSGEGVPLSNYETAYEKQLTQGTAEQKQREREQLDQTLTQRGIPVGSKAYSQQMSDLDTRYDKIFSNARNQAVTSGNQFQLSAINPLAAVGQGGFMQPNFQGFQAQQYQGPNATDIFNIQTSAQLQQQQIDKMKNQNGGGGGGGGGGSSGGGSPGLPFSSGPPGS